MTLDPFWVPFLAKILITASVVITAARTAERAGPFFGAIIACLPVLAVPIGAPLPMAAALVVMLAWSAGLILWRVRWARASLAR
ncbi:MAG TPA: hypothetical protein VKB68_13425 [Stellaceae bacterium]|nr:hypothetical protein [Stellaceae bacterium]